MDSTAVAATASPELKVSVSSAQTFRECEEKYYYSRVLNLVKDGQAPQLDLGIYLHSYLQLYYTAIQGGQAANAAHMAALRHVYDQATQQCEPLAVTCTIVGDEASAQLYRDLPAKFHRLAVGYYRVHGKDDATTHEILLIEAPFNTHLTPEIDHTGYGDLVTRDRRTGNVYLWEHKSHKTIPSEGFRLRNLQVAVYLDNLRDNYGIAPDGVLWNYLRTKEPEVPQLTKKGQMSRAGIETTWSVYRAALLKHGLDPADYAEMSIKLIGREDSMFYPRYTLSLPADNNFVLRDYRTTAKVMLERRRAWARGEVQPVRNPTTQCDWCQFGPLCQIALTHGSEPDPAQYGYSVRHHSTEKGGEKP